MFEDGSIRPVETIPGMEGGWSLLKVREGKYKREHGGIWRQSFSSPCAFKTYGKGGTR
jgi:hypothetical protein